MCRGKYVQAAGIHGKSRLAAHLSIWLSLIGCGSELANVHGTVTLDGQNATGHPDVQGTVMFSPVESGRGMANGILDKSGRYSLSVGATDGLVPGSYRVAVSIIRILPPTTPGGTPGGQLISPREYTNPKLSGLQAEVQRGSNTFDFALMSQQGGAN